MNMNEIIDEISKEESKKILRELQEFEKYGYLDMNTTTRRLISLYLGYNTTKDFFSASLEFQLCFYRKFATKYIEGIYE